jgi:hypothetical protein
VPDALYCEDCGYDFTTGQFPRPLEPRPGVLVTQPETGSVPLGSSGAVPVLGVPVSRADAAPAAVASSAVPDDGGQTLAPPLTSARVSGHVEWVVEIWIDPDWYAAQDVNDPCPSPGVPWVIPI